MTAKQVNSSELRLENAHLNDCSFVYKLRYSDSVRCLFEDKSIPDYKSHASFFEEHQNEYTVAKLYGSNTTELIGFCRMKCFGVVHGFRLIEPSIAVSQEARCRGVARELLGSAESELTKSGIPCIIFAKALRKNFASIRLFESNGYKRIDIRPSEPLHLIKVIGKSGVEE